MPANGGVPVEIDSVNGDTHGAAFSPDGAWIAYTRYADDAGQLTKIASSRGGRPVDLAVRWVATVLGLRRDEQRRWTVWSIAVAGGAERRITTLDASPRAEMYGCALHPDGKRFLASLDVVSSDIWLIDGAASQ